MIGRVFLMEKKIRPLKSIKTNEEYEEYKKYLDGYLIEYKWYQSHGKSEARDLVIKKAENYENDSDSRVALENRARMIENDEYIPALERNITAYMITIAEYEAKEENISPFEVLKGIFSNDEKIKEYLKKRDLKNKLEENGFPVVEPVSLSIQSTEDVLRQVFEECDFINIQKLEYALIPISEKANELQTEVSNMLKECLKENGIDTQKKDVEKSASKSVKTVIHRDNIHNDKHKEKDENEMEI